MRNMLKILANHSVLILSVIALKLADFIISVADFESFIRFALEFAIHMFFPVMIIYSVFYAVFFFRRENFLTPLLPLALKHFARTSNSKLAPDWLLWFEGELVVLVVFCILIRITAFILVLIFKEKLKKWSGEERVTSDVIFFVKVLCRKFCNAIT